MSSSFQALHALLYEHLGHDAPEAEEEQHQDLTVEPEAEVANLASVDQGKLRFIPNLL